MENIKNVSCGREAVYSVAVEGERVVLTVSGNGAMTDYINARSSQFAPYRDSVTDIVIKPGISVVGGYTFCDFVRLSHIELPETVRYLNCNCFGGAVSLEEITIPEGVQVIGPKSFDRCTALRRVALPSTLRAVDFKAFSNDEAIAHVSYNGTETQWRREVRVSMSARGNTYLLRAPQFDYAPVTARYLAMASRLADIIEHGGDGRLHIVVPDLTVPDCKGKSGDALMLVFPDGQVMAIDSGLAACGRHVMELIEALRIRHLDYFMTSHPHGDHVGNSMEVARYMCETMGGGVGTYLASGFEYRVAEPALADYLKQHGTTMRRDLRAGDEMMIGGVRMELFGPVDEDMTPEVIDDETVNNASLVTKFTYGKSTFLSSGDLYASRELQLAQKYGSALHADIAKNNHHGAFTSNTPEWVAAVSPKLLFSCCDDVIWTCFDERLDAAGIAHLRVSDCGLMDISMGRDADYDVCTEYAVK